MKGKWQLNCSHRVRKRALCGSWKDWEKQKGTWREFGGVRDCSWIVLWLYSPHRGWHRPFNSRRQHSHRIWCEWCKLPGLEPDWKRQRCCNDGVLAGPLSHAGCDLSCTLLLNLEAQCLVESEAAWEIKHLCSAYFVPGAVVSTLHILAHLFLPVTLEYILLIFLFYRWGNWYTKFKSILLKLTQLLIIGKVRKQTQAVWLPCLLFALCYVLHLQFLLFVFLHLPKSVIPLVTQSFNNYSLSMNFVPGTL